VGSTVDVLAFCGWNLCSCISQLLATLVGAMMKLHTTAYALPSNHLGLENIVVLGHSVFEGKGCFASCIIIPRLVVVRMW